MPVKPPPEMHDLQESIDGMMALRVLATRQTEGFGERQRWCSGGETQ